MNLFDLSKKAAFITGSAQGSGKSIANAMASYAAAVVLNAVNRRSSILEMDANDWKTTST